MLQIKPDLLFLTQRIPFPPFKGDKVRPYHILQDLSSRYCVHLGCVIDDPQDLVYRDNISRFCKTSYFAKKNKTISKFKSLRGITRGKSISSEYYNDAGLNRWVKQTIHENDIQAFFVFSSSLAPYVLESIRPDLAALCDLCDVDSAKWKDFLSKDNFSWLTWLYKREYTKVRELEESIVKKFPQISLVSDQESCILKNVYPSHKNKILTIENGVDLTYFDPELSYVNPFKDSDIAFVFTGTMDYVPNVDAVVWFATEIFPAIVALNPSVVFYIVGQNPSPLVLKLATERIIVTGRVPDVRPFLAYARCVVAPLKIARGVQNKVLEALAMARPLVATQNALNGLRNVGEEHAFVADTASDFVLQCQKALEVEGEKRARAGRNIIERQFLWKQVLQPLAQIFC